MILSFALTEKEFLDGSKTETRRDWCDRTLAMWQRAFDEGRLVHDAVNKGIHRGGHRIGKFKLTARPVREVLSSMTADSIRREGLAMRIGSVRDFCALVKQPPTKYMTVIRFEKISPKSPVQRHGAPLEGDL